MKLTSKTKALIKLSKTSLAFLSRYTF